MFSKKVLLCVSFAAGLCLSSCATSGFDGEGTLVGRVCDRSGNPVSGYELSFGVGRKAVSGLNGTFAVHGLGSGFYSMSGFARGWTSVDEEVEFRDRRSVLVVQVDSVESVYSGVEDALRNNDAALAGRLLDSVRRGNGGGRLFDFYSSLVEFCSADAEGARGKVGSKLEKMAFGKNGGKK